MKYLLGINAEAKGVTAVLYDLAGYEMGRMVKKLIFEEEDIRQEGSMAELWEKTAQAVRGLMKKTEVSPETVLAIAVSGQGGGLWAIDAEGEALEPAIWGSDGRAFLEEEVVNVKTPGLGALIHRNLGVPAERGGTLLLLKWLKKNNLPKYRRIAHLLSAKDWLRYQMTGDLATEMTDSGRSFFKIRDGALAQQPLTLLEIPEAARFMAPRRMSAEVAGLLTGEAAEQMGLMPGMPVVMGLESIAALVFGMGGVRDGQIIVDLSEICTVYQVHKLENCEINRGTRRYLHHIHPGLRIEAMPQGSGMTAVKWAMKEVARTSNINTIEGLVREAAPGCRGLTFYPCLSEISGEGTDVRGGFFGIDKKTTKAELLRAVYESVAFVIRESLEQLDRCDEISICGEGAMRPVLVQMIADITGKRVRTMMGEDFSARGAAMTAGIAIGKYGDVVTAADQCCRSEKIYQPIPSKSYEQSYQIFKESQKPLKTMWQIRKKLFQR